MPRFSVIVPVYNRIDEVADLMESLSRQTYTDFEAIIVEDGSSEPCKDVVESYKGKIDAHYHYKPNEGRSIARNYGMERSKGDFLIFFDSDCVIPPDYFKTLSEELDKCPLDCFGGPDAAHDSFSSTQKAINYSMTSFLTPEVYAEARYSSRSSLRAHSTWAFHAKSTARWADSGKCFRKTST